MFPYENLEVYKRHIGTVEKNNPKDKAKNNGKKNAQ